MSLGVHAAYAKLAPITAARDVACPVLVVGGAKDIFTPPEETRALHERPIIPRLFS